MKNFENDIQYTKEFRDMFSLVESYLKSKEVKEEVKQEMVEVV